MAKKSVTIIFLILIFSVWASTVGAAQRLTLILDWFPNVDHLPLYVARHQGLFSEEGLEIKIISPSDTSDGLKLAASSKVDIAVSYEPQTIIAAARGLDVIVFGRLVEHPLTTLLFLKGKGIEKPKDLEGKRIGYTVPGLMDVLLDAFAKVNDIQHYSAINVGFSIVQSLTAGKVDAVMGPFKTYETVEMAHREVPEADRKTETDAFKLTLPYYASDQKLEVPRWQQFADFALTYGLIKNTVDVASILWAEE